jgi:hypothetical protein
MTEALTSDNLLHFNGIDGDTGDYALPPMPPADLARLIRGEAGPENLTELRDKQRNKDPKHLGVREGVDPKNLAETGWGIVFPQDADPAIREALSPLLALREGQAGERFRIYAGEDGYQTGETKSHWLARRPRKMGPGQTDPRRVPYYLLICASPEEVPDRFQSQLDVQYAVGRIHFDDLDGYANYARSVVEAETGGLRLPRRMEVFGVANPMDQATLLSAKHLVAPVRDELAEDFADWSFTASMRERATKARLAELLGGADTPALLFTASHGMGFGPDSKRQLPHQGALLCQDWPGPGMHQGPIPQDCYFAGDDLGADANLLGLIAFFFACYGAGTPELDEFAQQAFQQPSRISPHPFMARLPMQMLARPRGGALAVIGHVDRAWSYSFRWPGAGRQTGVFRDAFHRLLAGHPVGSAMEPFGARYAELSTLLSDDLQQADRGRSLEPRDLAGKWTANNDARGYALIGDPAVRLPVAAPADQPQGREALQLQPASQDTGDAAATPGTDAGTLSNCTSEVTEDGSCLTIETYVSAGADPASKRLLAVCTRVAADGNIITDVGEQFANHAAVLRLHAELVKLSLARHSQANV